MCDHVLSATRHGFPIEHAECLLISVIDNLIDNPNEDDHVMPDFEQEEHVFMSARRLSSASADANQGHPAKGL